MENIADQAFDIVGTVLHLDGTSPITTAPNESAFWAERERHELGAGQVLSTFRYRETWDFQERHPDGDELAVVLTGEVDVLLDDGTGEKAVRVPTGCGAIVPAGTWHRLAVFEPSTVLFVTPVPARTEHRAASVRAVAP